MKIESSGPLLPPLAATAGGLAAVGALRPLSPLSPIKTVASAGSPACAAQLSSTTGDFDAAKVAAIRHSISQGHYQVNLGRVADGLLASVHELLNAQQP